MSNGGVNTGKGRELGRGLKAGNVTDFAENNGSQSVADTGDGIQTRTKTGELNGNGMLQIKDLVFDKLNLLQHLLNQQAHGVSDEHDAKRVFGSLSEFNGFIMGKPAPAGGGKDASPVFCDIDSESYNLNLDEVERLITPRTKAIILVHSAGLPVDMDRLNAIAAKHGVAVIEDCAHAHGSQYKGRMTGSLSRAAAFSFQTSKNLTSGEGGVILTDDEELYGAMYSRHTCGRKLGRPWYEHHAVASNLRLTETQAALLLKQFARLEEQTQQRLQNARRIEAALTGCPALRIVQHEQNWSTRRAYHLFLLQEKA